MKKLFSIIAVAALSTAFVACGPSKEEIAATEQKIADSLATIETARIADSTAAADAVAAEAVAAEAARVADSTRVADSLAAAPKGGKKKKGNI
jgi:hypothetical protein